MNKKLKPRQKNWKSLVEYKQMQWRKVNIKLIIQWENKDDNNKENNKKYQQQQQQKQQHENHH